MSRSDRESEDGDVKTDTASEPEHGPQDECEHCVVCGTCLEDDEPAVAMNAWCCPSNLENAKLALLCGKESCVVRYLKAERHSL